MDRPNPNPKANLARNPEHPHTSAETHTGPTLELNPTFSKVNPTLSKLVAGMHSGSGSSVASEGQVGSAVPFRIGVWVGACEGSQG